MKKSSLILNFSGYTLINLINSLTPFIVLPLLTFNLSAYDIGVIDLFTTSTIFLMPIVGLCFIQSISKLYFSFEDKSNYLSVLATSVFFLGTVTFVLAVFLLYGTNLLDISNERRILALMIVIYVVLNLAVEGFLLLKRNQENIKKFALVRLTKSFLEITLTILFLYLFEDYRVRIYAIMCSTVLASIVVLFYIIGDSSIVFKYDKAIVRRIFIYSSPLILHTFFASIINYSDRYFINTFLDTALLGQYSVVYQLCLIMSLLINSFNMAWVPYFMKNMMANKSRFNQSVKKIFNYYIIFLFLFGLILFLIMPYIYKYYVGSDYLVESTIYATLLGAYFFNGLYRFKISYLFYYEKTFTVAKLSFITALINIILNYICIKSWGIYGAAFSTLISYLVLYLVLEVELLIAKKNESIS